MNHWQKISLIFCAYGILKEFRPTEPFVTKYLYNPPMNFTRDEITQDLFTVVIYTTMLLLSVIIFPTAGLFRYEPIIMNSLSGVMLIFCRTLFTIQVVEVFYGLFISYEVACHVYIYAEDDEVHYQEVSGQTRTTYHIIGRAVSGVASQIMVLTDIASHILIFTLGVTVPILDLPLLLSTVSENIYFINIDDAETSDINPNSRSNLYDQNYRNLSQNKIIKGFHLLWINFKTAFTDLYVVKWAFWWALATCGYSQILSYIQLLWKEILKNEGIQYNTKLNCATEAAYTLASAISAFCFGKWLNIIVDWPVYGELVLFICSTCIGILLIIMAETSSIWVAYGTKVVYAMIYHSMITVSNSEVAKHVNPDSYGLIFGFTTSVALVLQTILTVIVKNSPKMSIRNQFEVYSGYFIILGVIFGLKTLYSFIKSRCSSRSSITITNEVPS